jgi:HEAT repeat protein
MNALLEHPTGSILVAYGLGQVAEKDLAGIDAHLAECDLCRQVVDGVSPDTLLTLLRNAPTDTDSVPPRNGFHAVPSGATQDLAAAAPPAELAAHPRYKVGELLGVGGMGAVYKAEHLLMERPVALKVLNRKFLGNPATVERFRREVRAAARLTHPNIVAAFDAEQAGDVHFLAMEYVGGVSQAALGLEHAHARGMVHRDIKPHNLMLTPAGQVKILDFGLARFAMESGSNDTSLSVEIEPAAPDHTAIRLTHTGLVMGTPDYIAPEQARDSHLADIRSDIYSLGCTFYELLAGQAPFPDGNALHKVKGHLSRTPQPLDTLRRDAPIELVRIVERMMAKDPAHRYQTPTDVVAALAPFTAPPKPPRRKRKVALAACAAFLTIALAGVIYVQTDRGAIIIETSDEKIAVMIQNAGGVKIVDQVTNREYFLKRGEHSLPSGDYQIEVTDPAAGFEFETKRFELKRGKDVRLTARFIKDIPLSGKPKAVADNIPREAAANDDGPLYLGKPASFWFNQFQDAAPQYRVEAVNALGNLAAKNKGLIPVIVSALKDDAGFTRDKEYRSVGREASNILRSFGPDVLPVLLERVDRTSPTALLNATHIIYRLGPKAAAAVPLLTEAMRMDDWSLQYETADTLAAIGADAKPAIPAIIDFLGKALESDQVLKSVEERALEAKERADQRAREAKERAEMAERNAKLGGKGKGGFSSFAGGVDRNSGDGPPGSRFGGQPTAPVRILEKLFMIDPIIKSVIPEGIVNAGERRTESGTNLEASVLLWKQTHAALKAGYPTQQSNISPAKQATMGTKGDAAAKQTAKDEDFYQGKPTTFWLNQFKDTAPAYRREAVEALGKIVEKNRSLIPTLVAALKDRDDYVATVAATQLRSLGPDAIPDLLKDVDQTSPDAMRHAADAIGAVGAKGKAAAPMLTHALRMDNWSMRRAVVDALARIGPDAKPAIPVIVDVLGRTLEFKEVIEQLERSAAPPDPQAANLLGGKAVKGKKSSGVAPVPVPTGNFSIPAGNRSLPVEIVEVLLVIDPEIKNDLADGMLNAGQVRTFSGINLAAPVAVWKQTYEALEKKYPNPQPIARPAKQPQAGAALELAPMPKHVESDEGPVYLGKRAAFWLAQLQDGAPQYRLEAVDALGSLARKNTDLVGPLVAVLNDDAQVTRPQQNAYLTVGGEAHQKLAAIGPDVLPALLERVDRNSPVALAHAANLIERFGAKVSAPAVLPLLVHSLQMDNLGPRYAATRALAGLGPHAKPAIPLLVDALGSSLSLKHVTDELERAHQQWPEPAKESAEPKVKPNVGGFGGGKKKGSGPAFPIDHFSDLWPVVIVEALLRIEPDIKGDLPKSMLDEGGYRSKSGINLRTPVTLWKEAHAALKKAYPTFQPLAPAPLQSAISPAAKGEGPFYLGKPASHWLGLLEDAAPQYRLDAVDALGQLAERDKDLVLVLISAMRDSGQVSRDGGMYAVVGDRAKKMLINLGPDVLPLVLDRVDRSSPVALERAADLVRTFALDSKNDVSAALPLLVEALQNEDWHPRNSAAKALAIMGPKAKPALPLIVDFLGASLDWDFVIANLNRVHREAVERKRAEAVSNAKQKGRPLDAPAPDVRYVWTDVPPIVPLFALLRIDPEIKSVLPAGILDTGLIRVHTGKAEDPSINFEASVELWKQSYQAVKNRYPSFQPIGPPAKQLERAAATKDGPLYLGKPASHWLARLDDAAPEYRLEALDALGNLAEKKKDLVPVIVSVLKDNRFVMRDLELKGQGFGLPGKGKKGGDNSAGGFGGKKQGANPFGNQPGTAKIIKRPLILGDRAMEILLRLGPDVVPALIDHVDQTSPDAVRRALILVAEFGPKAKAAAAVPLAIKALQNPEWTLSYRATETLGMIGPSAKPAIPLIVDYLGDRLGAKQVLDELEARIKKAAQRPSAADGPGDQGKAKEKGAAPEFEIGSNGILDAISIDTILDALLHIEPEIKTVLPAGLVGAGKIRSASGINMEAPAALWKQAQQALKKRYPTYEPSVSSLQPPAHVQAAQDDGPFYLGKPLSHWRKLLEDGSPEYRLEGLIALGNLASKKKDLVPVIVSFLGDNNVPPRKDVESATGKQGSFKPPLSVGGRALAILVNLGPDVIPDLIEHVDRKSPRAVNRAVTILSQFAFSNTPKTPIRKEALPLLIQALEIDDPMLRAETTELLKTLTADARPAIPLIVDFLGGELQREEVILTINTTHKLAALRAQKAKAPADGGDGKKKDKAADFQVTPRSLISPVDIVDALLTIDPRIKSDLPEGLLHTGQLRSPAGVNVEAPLALWTQAHAALKKAYPYQPPAIKTGAALELAPMPQVAAATSEPNRNVPLYKDKPADYWRGRFDDRDPGTRLEALKALGSLWPKDAKLLPILIRTLKDSDAGVASAAVTALGSFGPEAAPALVELLSKQTLPAERKHAIRALGLMGPSAKEAVPLLIETLKVDDWGVREAAVVALGQIGPDAKAALPALVDVFGRYLETPEFLEFEKLSTNERGGRFGLSAPSLAIQLVKSLLAIDGRARDFLGDGVNSVLFDATSGQIQTNAWAPRWRATYEALKKQP